MILSKQRMQSRFLQIASLLLLPLLFSGLFLYVKHVEAAPTVASLTINFHVIADTPTYQNLRWQVISVEEGAELAPYLDGKCIPTIGIGFNLTNKQILSIVLTTLAPGLQTAQFNELQGIVSQNYVSQINKGKYTCTNTFPANLDDAMAAFHQQNNAIPATLAFANVDPQMRTTFDLAVKNYEKQVDKWLAGIPNSLERIAFVSLAYNGLINLGTSPTLRADLINGNRALAWYEIRYDSEAENDSQNKGKYSPGLAKGLATRRDFESDLFGLYDGNPPITLCVVPTNLCSDSVSNTNATQVMSMVADYETRLYTSVVPNGSGLYNNRYYVNPDTLVGQAQTNYAPAITAIQAVVENFGVQDLLYNLGPAESYLLYNAAATSAGMTLLLNTPTAIQLAAANPFAVFVQSSAAGGSVTMNDQSDLVYSNTDDTIMMGAGLEELTFGSGQHTADVSLLHASNMTQNLPLNTITFDGQSIAGIVQPGSTDAFGRTYTLSCGKLTITKGADILTIKGFQNGDFGLTVQGEPICFYVTSITSVPGGASQVILSVPDINNTTCASVIQVWTASGTPVGDVNWNNGPLFGWYWPSFEADVNGQYYMRTACSSTAEPYLNTGSNPFIYSQVFTVINGNYTL